MTHRDGLSSGGCDKDRRAVAVAKLVTWDVGRQTKRAAPPPDDSPMLHGAPIGRHGWAKIALLGGLLGFLFRGEIASLVHLWTTDPNWSHGFLIPLFSLYFLQQKKGEILRLDYTADPLGQWLRGHRPETLRPGQTRANYLGLLLLLLVLAFYAFNVVSPAGYAYFRPVSMLAAAGAVVLLLGGWRLVHLTWLPLAFLLFAIPLPRRYYVGLTLPLRHLSAVVATTVLNLVPGLDATTSGAVIDLVYHGRRLEPGLDVAEACSGMRLLMAFLALGVAMAYLHERPRWQRAVLLLSTVPIAILCNIIRVTATGLLHVLVDPKYAQGVYHDLLGLAMLPLAFGFYELLARFMASLFVEEEDTVGAGVIVRRRTRELKFQAPNPKSQTDSSDQNPKLQTPRAPGDGISVIKILNFRFVWNLMLGIWNLFRIRNLRPAFVLCTAVLALAGTGMSLLTARLGLYLKKEPLPLQKPLGALAEEKLAPYRVVGRLAIADRDVLKSLGTEDYLQWLLEDPREPAESPVRKLMLFITYYPQADRVPHVPEECYTGGGYQRLATNAVLFRVGSREIPGRYLLFEKTAQEASAAIARFPVLYLFRVNGEYAGSRDEARLALNKGLFRPHSYFCKIELVFNQAVPAPTREIATAAGAKLLTVLLPLLEQEHWPALE